MGFQFSADLELGKKSDYTAQYNADLLFPITRATQRLEINIDPKQPPFWGFDSWNHYEVSWLNPKGKPVVATAQIVYDCRSPYIIESKSLKLYFNSLNNTQFESISDVENTIKNDIALRIETDVFVTIHQLGKSKSTALSDSFMGEYIDDLDVSCSVYSVEPSFLSAGAEQVEETLCSDLLKSNCLVTNQPDWGSVQIHYKGHRINREGLLQYIVSFRNHNEFHEQCIERIFVDIMAQCKPQELTVYGRYTRRGGLDINPYRSTLKSLPIEQKIRLQRQ